MDQSLNGVPVVVKHKHNRIQAQLQHVGERLHGQVQAPFAGDKDTSFVVIVLLDGFERSHCGAGGVANTAKDCLVVHTGTAG